MSTENVDRTPVAKDIWCYSPREKAFTWHVVVNHDANGYVDRVQCKVSGSTHKYKRQNAPAKTGARKVIRRSAGKTTGSTRAAAQAQEDAASLEQTWFDGVKAWGDKVVAEFDPKKFFDVGDVFTHKIFGKGVVQKRRDNKVDVLFRNEIKTLPSKKS